MDPKITVLMSVYNDIKYLRESVESILSQSFKDFEFLIFDDASTDGSAELLEEFAGIDNRINLIKNEKNKGLSFNLSEGVKLAKAPWIARMDADDIALFNRLEVQYNYIKQNPELDVLGSYVIDIDESGREIELRKVPTTHEKIAKLIWTCPFIHPTVMFKKDSIINVGSYDKTLRRRQDYELWFRCHENKLKFRNIESALLYYRSTDDYYRKNNFKVQFQQATMGYKGAFKVKASPVAYIGISVAFFKGILPHKIRKPVTELLKRFDPRKT